MGATNPIKSPVDLLLGDQVSATALVYLYLAPFAPCIFYSSGHEHFVIPVGWGLLRSRQGLVMWLELMDDIALRSIVPGVLEPPAGVVTLRLPPPEGGLARNDCIGKLELKILRTCGTDAAIAVSNEDVAVLRPRGDGDGVWASVRCGGDAPEADVSTALMSWLSAWEISL